MKKFLLTVTAIFLTVLLFAQEDMTEETLVNKKGIAILPQAGDFAIGIDASPFFNLIGNMVRLNDFTGPFNDPMSFNFVDGSSLYGKYFLTDNTALRAKIDIMMSSQTLNNYVVDDANAGDPNARVTDTWKHTENGINIGLGMR